MQIATAKSVIDGQSNIITQAIVSEFIRQRHFSRHIRRMRLLYKKNQDDLVNLINLHLKDKLTPVGFAGFSFNGMEAAILKLKRILDRHI